MAEGTKLTLISSPLDEVLLLQVSTGLRICLCCLEKG